MVFGIECRQSQTVVSWTLEALADIRLDQVLPLTLPWPFEAPVERCRVFQNGFQSWTPTGSVAARSPQRYPRLTAFSTMNHHVDSPYWGRRREGLLSHEVMVVEEMDVGEAFLFGFLSSRTGLGELFLQNRGEPSVEASLDYGGRCMPPGSRLEGEPLLLAKGPSAQELLERWAEELGAGMGARVKARSPVGWCSWYEYYNRVSEADVLANLEFLRAHDELGIELMQLDDGYQEAVGDWLLQSSRFPRGLAPLAAETKEAGLTAGIWLAPFFAEPRSRLFREHPDWFLCDERGRLIDAGFNPVWRARLRSLDLTHPEVEGWLEEIFEGLVKEGFDYFKIDFIYAGLRHGARRDPSKSPVEAYRNGLRIIRETIGEERFLLGCGAPLSPSIGFVDGMRIGADVKESWDSRAAAFLGQGAGYPSARLAIAGTIARAHLHRRTWLNDPDCLLVRDRNTKLTLVEVETLVTILGMSGGMLFLSDDMTRLSKERLELAKAVLPPTTLGASPGNLMERNPPDRFVLEGQGGRLVSLVNWENKAKILEVPRSAGGDTVFDFWEERLRAAGEPLKIAGHGVAALLMMESENVPKAIGTTLHLTALLDGRLRSKWDAKRRALTLSGEGMARRRGRIWVRLCPGDEMEEENLPQLVERVERWEEGVVLTLEADREEWSVELFLAEPSAKRGAEARE